MKPSLFHLQADYEGGGVRFLRYNCTLEADKIGKILKFPHFDIQIMLRLDHVVPRPAYTFA
jgi:hypothetical protein